jgi:ATP-dependent Zn protease
MNRTIKTASFWLVIVLTATLLWQVVRSGSLSAQIPEINYSTFVSQAEAGNIARVNITGTRIEGEYRNGKGNFRLTGPTNPGVFLSVLQEKGVEIRFRDVRTQSIPLQLLGTWAPLFLLAGLWLTAIRVLVRKRAKRSAEGNLDPSDRKPLMPQ